MIIIKILNSRLIRNTKHSFNSVVYKVIYKKVIDIKFRLINILLFKFFNQILTVVIIFINSNKIIEFWFNKLILIFNKIKRKLKICKYK